jgi:hypothetical protein
VHARKRGVESFDKREKDVKRGKSMSILYLLILDIPTYGLILMIIGFER